MLNEAGIITIGRCRIDPTAQVCHGAIVGKAFRPLIGVPPVQIDMETVVGPNAYIGHYSIVGTGSILATGVIIDDFSLIECEVIIGQHTLVIYRANICNEASIGADCVIGGFVAERVAIGDRSRVFGKIVHSQHNPRLTWDAPEAEEPSAVISDDVFIGFDAIVVGRVTVGAGSYICAGATITKDVPPKHVAHSVNNIIPFSQWRGRLSPSPFFNGKLPGTPDQDH